MGYTIEERRAFYVNSRIANQFDWYCRNSRLNDETATKWYYASLVTQAGALVLAIIRVSASWLGASPVALLTTLAAAFAAWSQFGRHEELAKSYGLAAQELETMRALAEGVTAEDQLAQLVTDAEGSISREHTMWITKRGEPLPSRLPHKPSSS
jgi:hypothetical protein